MRRDYYETLNVSRNATDEELKKLVGQAKSRIIREFFRKSS